MRKHVPKTRARAPKCGDCQLAMLPAIVMALWRYDTDNEEDLVMTGGWKCIKCGLEVAGPAWSASS